MSASKVSRYQVFISRPDISRSVTSFLKDYDLDIWHKEEVMSRNEFLKRIHGKDALFIHSGDRIDAEALDSAGNNLKVIATLSSGYNHIDVPEVKKRGIKIGYTAGILNDAVASMAILLLLSITRKSFESHRQITEGKWQDYQGWFWMNGFGLKDSVIGIFGLGGIGMEVARRLVPFKPAKILYVSRKVKPEADEVKAVRVDLEQLLKESDIVILTSSLNDETRGIINEERLGLMKRTAFIVNVSRGAVIDQDALLRALKNKTICGAALDVMTPEPIRPDNELVHLDNCVTTPHIGSGEVATREAMIELTCKNIIAGLNGKPLPMEL
ncbi:hypothetical protein RUM44_011878 [Polyplax serrata]|uniref:Glyoxylate reductase n=1 Tax=Polyplax serrata TaxID=468196 RepID=A0ABR1BA23_POLSC